jgi:hypothetical protein
VVCSGAVRCKTVWELLKVSKLEITAGHVSLEALEVGNVNYSSRRYFSFTQTLNSTPFFAQTYLTPLSSFPPSSSS